MAIKAGLVGVNPKGVDKEGMPIGSGGSVDAYTKAQTDALLAGKVGTSQLTANSKAFHFAFDETSQKYGYKLDGEGAFIPFEEAADDGIVLSDPIMTGITPTNSSIENVSGGYMLIDNVYYLHIKAKLKIAASGGHTIFDTFISAFDAAYSDSFKKVMMTSGSAKCYLYKDSSNHYTVSNLSGTFNVGDLVDIVGTAF